MVKLTPELINASMQYINPCRDRELDLRGYKIPQIENMGATLDQFDTIDFSDNDLRRLDGFPYLPRIKCLLLNNNRIVRIADNLHEFLPNLESIILTGNNLQDFSDLDPLVALSKLETLSLLTNPITTDPHYREYIAYKFPKLRLLDFRKIRQKDRQAAVELFKSKKGKEILKEIAKKAKAAAANPAAAESNSSKVPTASQEDVQRIRDAIKNATSLQEVERLTRILQSGNIPENLNAENGNGNGAPHEDDAMEM
ncbi:probable U2 small nuclear ribonucleoprotein A' [Sitodiplosis mosellana]|uniref:probable U2 small nuclear ribonucleoprotein A' n=1 Tax=Sitodiplosis mosellana TaxID=263140 RepID=UPI002443766F|nr:probable U2 small nuclear ribonucleoprotein A' [Sitodiplosis mosellana]